jgi:predicted enzyme related to lactoylglutathione lyase
MLKIRRVGAAIPAQDMERARQFYEQKLGFEPAQAGSDGGVLYMFGETGFMVFPSMGKASGNHTQMAFDVDDVEEAVRQLKRAGVEPEEYDMPGFTSRDGIVERPDGEKGAWFKDSEGNLIGLGVLTPVTTRN